MQQEWQEIAPIPAETSRRARAVFSRRNFYLRLGDQLPAILHSADASPLLALEREINGPIPVYALVTFFQVVEELSDTQASDALRMRLDWKYALHLPQSYPWLRQGVLCGYRQKLMAHGASKEAFDRLVRRLAAMDPFRGNHVCTTTTFDTLTAVCLLNRLKWALEGMRDLLHVLASRRTAWLADVARPHWYSTYWSEKPLFSSCVCCVVEEEMLTLSHMIAKDIEYILEAISQFDQEALNCRQEVNALQRIWRQQFAVGEGHEWALRPICSFCGTRQLGPQREGI